MSMKDILSKWCHSWINRWFDQCDMSAASLANRKCEKTRRAHSRGGIYCRHCYQNITFFKVLVGKTSKPTTLLEESFVFLGDPWKSFKNRRRNICRSVFLLPLLIRQLPVLVEDREFWLSLSRRCLSGRSPCCLWTGSHNFLCERRRNWASSLKGQVLK